MLPIRFDDITPADILRLVTDKVAERKTLEYKKTLNIGSIDDKAEFLADVSSFANASGGDIIFGITDLREGGNATGLPGEVVGLTLLNASSECSRIEQIVRDGIEPRIPVVQPKAFYIAGHGIVIVVRVTKSWIAPHMVSFANRTRFFSRNSTGKFQLDVHQIGAAFAEQRSLGERLRSWKADRIGKALSGEGPVQQLGAKLLYHFIPASALVTDDQAHPRQFDSQKWGNGLLMSLSIDRRRYNADGLLFCSIKTNGDRSSYLQVFRDGCLEYGDSYVFDYSRANTIASGPFEDKIVDGFEKACALQKHLQVQEPIYVTLTLLEVKGWSMALPFHRQFYGSTSDPFDRDIVLCPDVLIQNTSEGRRYPSTLLPLVDAIWQAAGLPTTPYTEEWKVQ